MSLRFRLILLTLTLMILVILLLTGFYVNSIRISVLQNALERNDFAGQQVNRFILDKLNKTPVSQPTAGGFDQTKQIWRQMVKEDPEVKAFLLNAVASMSTSTNNALLEVSVAGDDGTILASSTPERRDQPMQRSVDFTRWLNSGFYQTLSDLLLRPTNFDSVVPLGIKGEALPLFTIQVVTSAVLLRAEIVKQLEAVGVVALFAMLASLVITTIATSRVLRPIRRIEQTIDRITQGQFAASEPEGAEGSPENRADRERMREFAAVENKLNMLGQQYSGVRQDATNLKHSLDEMVERMASQLDVASRFAAISRVSSGVAHEIKNPLNAISLRLDLMKARLESGDDNVIPEIDILSNEVRRLDRVVKTFLDFSRPVELKLTDVDLAQIAREISVLVTPQAKSTGIEVEFQGPRVAPGLSSRAWMRGDPDLLKHALLNLITNAIEAMKHGGKLKITMGQTAQSVSVEISDSGPGIPSEARDQVFQLYFTTKEKGSGIGLAMTYRTAQLHNGTVDFTSEVGRGTTFRMKFPARVRQG